MSIHLESSPEARERLRKENRLRALTSVISSLVVILAILLVLAFFVLPSITKTETFEVAYVTKSTTEETIEKPEVSRLSKPVKPPSSSSAAKAKVIATNASSDVAIPTFELPTQSSDFGAGDTDFGSSWGGTSEGSGGGGGGFGSATGSPGSLSGRLYDFKQDSEGKPLSYNPKVDYAKNAKKLQRAQFRDSAFSDYYQAPQSLYLAHIAIPFSPAEEGPRYFKAEKEVKPRGWIANYSGKITAPESGEYRFVGLGDDYLTVSLDREIRLFACWHSLQPEVSGSWRPSETNKSHTIPSFSDKSIIYGDWIEMRKGQSFDINVALGERPGGKVGFILMIQKKGVKYKEESGNGRPILPIFATRPISPDVKKEITRGFKDFKFEWDNVPYF